MRTMPHVQVSTSTKSGNNPVFHEKFALPVKDVHTDRVIFSVLKDKKLRRDTQKCQLSFELKEVAHQGVIQDTFDLEGGGKIEVGARKKTRSASASESESDE